MWELFFAEHGYPLPKGRVIDKNKNHNGLALTNILQSTHVNCALPIIDDEILASLFVPGELVKINKKTKKVDVILKDLSHPHSIRQYADGYMICDTQGKSVILLNHDLTLKQTIALPSTWIQDATFIDDTLFIIDNSSIATKKNKAAGEYTKCYLAQINNGEKQKSLVFGEQYRLFEMQAVTEQQAHYWSEAWQGNNCDIPDVTWS